MYLNELGNRHTSAVMEVWMDGWMMDGQNAAEWNEIERNACDYVCTYVWNGDELNGMYACMHACMCLSKHAQRSLLN